MQQHNENSQVTSQESLRNILLQIHSENTFQKVIAKERLRSDFNNHGFSLVSFQVDPHKTPDVAHLFQQLKEKVRVTDEIGWFGDNSIGVLLFNTSGEGADKFITNLTHENPDKKITAQVITTYPTEERKKECNLSTEAHNRQESTEDCPTFSLNHIFLERLPVWKRIIDIVVASLALVFLSPLLLLIAAVVKSTSKGSILFKQRRAGFGGKAFSLYKFRSMYSGAEARKAELLHFNQRTGPVFKMENDPRITPLGRFLRQWSLDELPQLVNVLLGDMTLVGPRPPTLDEVEQYDNWHNNRLEIMPGITCIWQVYARHEKSFENWVRLDIRYKQKRSFLLDMKLLVLTIPAVLSRRGAW